MSSDHPSGTVWRLSAIVPSHGVAAVEAALDPFCPSLTIFETAEDSGTWRLEGYADVAPDAVAVARAVTDMAAIQGLDAPEVSIDAMAPRDWVAENLQTFDPLSVGRYYVYGSHVSSPPPMGRIALLVNPGAAFGSGRHESTSGCLDAFDRLARSRHFTNMLDMGCGSGILALAMARTWNGRVLAVDIDRRAVQVARDNARLNGQASRVAADVGAGYASGRVKRTGPYDLIVANILARPLCKMARDAARHLAPGGVLVLAGFLTRDWRRVYAAHQMQGLRLVERLPVGDWSTLVLTR